MLLLSTEFEERCKNATVYLDTNAFIYAYEQTELLDLVARLTESGTAFATISSVEYEFTRGSRSLQEIKDRRSFIRGLVHRVIPIGPLLESDKNDAFSAAMSLVVGKRDSQYTDYLLAVALHKFSNSIEKQYILSADVAAFPPKIFNIDGVISLRLNDAKLVHVNLISLDIGKYTAIIDKIVKSK